MNQETEFQTFVWRAFARLLWPAAASLVLLVAVLVLLVMLKGSFSRFETQMRYQPPVVEGGAEFYSTSHLAKSQSLYVPVYSHVYVHDGVPFPLTATLSIRNTDSASPLFVQRVFYYDSEGILLRSYLEQPLRIAPLATAEFLVEEGDASGGSGANFVVEWASENALTQPVVEAVMIGASGQQGISLICPAVVISETRRETHETPPALDEGDDVAP